ncbi:MAG TPA: hypothetical protein VHY37_12445 [Tepidisphaeraceae bacterium]|nr:hypothetical protein [Tepidisphaeraceae bacterium]
MTRKDWPFEVVPSLQRSPLHKAEIAFLERAHRMGFHPSMDGFNFLARNDERGRTSWILRRSARAKVWEIVFDQPRAEKVSACVDDLSIAADAVLAWLSGQDAQAAIELCREHVVMPPRAGQAAKSSAAAMVIAKK